MARQLDEWEQRIKDEQEKAEKKETARRKTAFIKKWVSATPEKQAKIIFNIMEDLEGTSSFATSANSHHIRL
jgi:hypothetical protein